MSSYINTPKLYQSNEKSWPFLLIISGARYLVVPQKDLVESLILLDKPKSVIFIKFSSSIRIFSGFKSLYTMWCLCKVSKAKQT